MYKILVSGYYGFNNIGDESILQTIVQTLQEKLNDVEITILSQNPEDTREKYGVRAVPRMSVFSIIREIRRCDLLISGGGSLLQDATSRSSILYYLSIIRMAQLFRRKVFIYSQGIGPITSRWNRKLTAHCLRKADVVAVRDVASKRFLMEMGVPDDMIHITADPVLRLRPANLETGRRILREAGYSAGKETPLVGWAVKSPTSSPDDEVTKNLIDQIEASIRWLHDEQGVDSVLIPFHFEQDQEMIGVLSERMGDQVISITHKHLSEEMLSIIGNMDLLVGVRLHSLIYAAIMNVPSMGISYDPKVDAFLESTGRTPVSDVTDFTLEKFQREYRMIVNYRDEILEDTGQRIRSLVSRLDMSDNMLKELIEENESEYGRGRTGSVTDAGAAAQNSVSAARAADVAADREPPRSGRVAAAQNGVSAARATSVAADREPPRSGRVAAAQNSVSAARAADVAADREPPRSGKVAAAQNGVSAARAADVAAGRESPRSGKAPGSHGQNATVHDTPSAGRRGGLISAIGGVMLVTIIAKVFGILRESVQANVFGAADAYYSAFNKTIYLYTTAAYAMCVAAVPVITQRMSVNRKDGERAANNLTTLSLLISLGALVIWELLTVGKIGGRIWGADSAQAIPYIRVMALSLPIIVVAYLFVSVFQSMDYYALQGSMGLPYSVFLIAYLLLFGRHQSIMMYVIMVTVAWLLQMAMALPYAVRERYLYRPVLDLKQDYIRSFIKTSLVTIVTSSMYLFCYLTDASRAAHLGHGVTSAFYYADKLFTPLVTTFIYSISAVMFPKFNREYTKSDPKEYKSYVWNITLSTIVVVLPVCVILMAFGGPIIKVLFESGNFTPRSTVETTRIFEMYALGMAGFSVIDLLTKAWFTMNRTAVPLLLSLGVIAGNLIMDVLFGQNGTMLALSTAVMMTAGAVAVMALMFHGEHVVRLGPILKSLIASLVIGLMANQLRRHFVPMTDGKLMLILKCGMIGMLAMLVFIMLCYILRLDVVTERTDRLLRRNGK